MFSRTWSAPVVAVLFAVSSFALPLYAKDKRGVEKKVITVWDQFGYEGLTAAGPAMDTLVTIYEERNPKLTAESG